MKINGREVIFHFNIRAAKRIAHLCPGRDLTHIDKIFDASDFPKFIDNMTELAVAMSCNKQNDRPLEPEEIEELDLTDLMAIVDDMRRQFGIDKQTTVQTQAIKKKAPKGGKQSNSD